MPLTLSTPETETKTVNTIVITDFNNSLERTVLEICYIKLLEDGTPFQRGSVTFNTVEEIQALYAELDVIIATGKTFEEASKELLYSKIATGTLV